MDCRLLTALFSLISFVYGEVCTSPQVATDTYTSKNIALSTETAYVAEFSVSCKEDVKGQNLYAVLDGVLVPVALNPDSYGYQISWTSDHKKAVTGAISIPIYNDEGNAAYRKAQRSEGGDVSAVAPLFTLTVNHPGVTREGLFVQTEFIAVVTALLVWWGGNTMRNQIME